MKAYNYKDNRNALLSHLREPAAYREDHLDLVRLLPFLLQDLSVHLHRVEIL